MSFAHAGTLDLQAIKGIRIGTALAGIRQNERDDIVVFELSEKTNLAATFTKNKFCAAPVIVAKEHLEIDQPRYLLINSGNANAGLGTLGVDTAQKSCEGLAALAATEKSSVLPFSTGVIGEPLPLDKLLAALPAALKSLSGNNWDKAAKGILTTDTCTKGCTRQLEIDGQTATITGIAKGSGMIKPDMATMLAYIATDLPISQGVLQGLLKQAVDVSFNSITVDGDTSTNDAAILMATNELDIKPIKSPDDPRCNAILAELINVCCYLAEAIVKDGEGATKLIKIQVNHAANLADAREVAYTVAHSPLVKTAFFASDPNWGRILAAVGRANIKQLNVDNISIYLADTCIVKNGMRDNAYTEEQGQAVMDQYEILLTIDLAEGDASTTILSCDLSYDYVKINAEYRS
ncbi:MAG: bifunctional glutamate N-acetyltransferase/amino-acid acetyltransferase ArgJ [Cycloclasticus sp.]|nr:bifunctional glutamate N-acetyltransferase/amino-acid acetyltransferase ArgJ [Cycloclasticus sp.]